MILYTAEMELAPEHLEAFTAWYNCRHAPDLYQAGFEACTSFRGTGNGMSVLNLYRLPNWELFETPAYRAVGPNDPYGPPIIALARAKANTPYEVVRSWSRADAAGQPVVDAAWLSAIRFEASPEIEAGMRRHLAQAGAAKLAELGALQVHLARRSRPHPLAPSDRPSGTIFVEWQHRPPDQDPVLPMLADAAPVPLAGTSVFVGHRVYPWPNRMQPQ